MRDAETKGGDLKSGTSEKQDIHSVKPSDLGMGTVGGDPAGGKQMPQGNPEVKVDRGHIIR